MLDLLAGIIGVDRLTTIAPLVVPRDAQLRLRRTALDKPKEEKEESNGKKEQLSSWGNVVNCVAQRFRGGLTERSTPRWRRLILLGLMPRLILPTKT